VRLAAPRFAGPGQYDAQLSPDQNAPGAGEPRREESAEEPQVRVAGDAVVWWKRRRKGRRSGLLAVAGNPINAMFLFIRLLTGC